MTSKVEMSGSVNKISLFNILCASLGAVKNLIDILQFELKDQGSHYHDVEARVFPLKQGFERTGGFVLN